MSDGRLVVAEGLGRDFAVGDSIVHALRDVDFAVPEGTLAVVHGRSGSGKTTLLNVIGGLDRPTRGRIWLDGEEVSGKSEDALVELRREKIGFVFQSFGLVPILSAAENIEVPLRLRKVDPEERTQRVRELLDLVGLGGRAGHRPYELSGGEQQRVAICRALANRPRLLIADEPTAQLDSGNAVTIMELVRELVASEGVSALVATHDPLLLEVADAVVELHDGRLAATRAA
jgi:putative ABC transport system ATP-binding protein